MDKIANDKYDANDTVLVAEPVSGMVAPSERNSGQKFSLPAGLPRSVDEALTDIDEGELEFERGETFSHKEVMQMVWNRIEGYGGKVQ